MLVNLGQFEDENPLDIMQSFWGVKMLRKIQKGHCIRQPHVVVSA